MSHESRPQATEDTPPPHHEHPPPERSGRQQGTHTVARVILTSVVVLAVVTALATVYLYRHLNGNLDVQDIESALGDERPEEIYTGNGKPLDILVLGDDTRSGDNRIDSESGGGSDTTILVHLSADRTRAYAISIPRDSIVDRPDCGEDDDVPGETEVIWNEAFAKGQAADPTGGGAACVIRQLEATTDVRVEHYVAVDFSGFTDMVDAVGGVPVCVPREIRDPSKGIFVPQGDPAVLRGDQALDYVRVRSSIGDESDLGRIKRQQTFIAALVHKVRSADTLASLPRVVTFLDAATDSLEVDAGLDSVTRIGKIAMQLQSIGLDEVQFVTVPNAYFPEGHEHFNRVYWTEDAKQLWRHVRTDRPLPRRLTDSAITAAKPPGASETPSAGEPPSGSESPDETVSPTETPTDSGESAEPGEPPETDPTRSPAVSAEEARQAGLCS